MSDSENPKKGRMREENKMKFSRGTWLAAALILLSAQNAIGQEPTKEQFIFAASNLQQELFECISFHSISEAAFSKPPLNDGWEEAVKRSQEHRRLLSKVAGMLATSMDQKQEAIVERLKLANEHLGEEMGRNFSNYAVLLTKYAQPCAVLAQDSDPRFAYWLSVAQEAK
jgi:hypothetical protein